jgi:Flp pilus assembly protein TadD
MLHDWRGQQVTAGGAATVAGVDAFVRGFLAYENCALDILPAADADPDCALANAYAAMLWLFLESPEGPPKALPYLARAEAAPHATERERMVLAATRAWADNDIPRAIAIGEDAAQRFPRELALAKVTQYHHFNLGDAPGMLRIAEKILPANGDLAYAHGLAAFAYEQCHLLQDAERAARTAIRLQRKEPWAHHALAHVLLTQGRNAEGRAFLDDVKDTWTDLNSFMLTHNWWHLSLVMIEQGEAERVLEHYATHIWGVWKEYSQDQVGAVSLLARLELAGVDVGDRWQDLADHLRPRVHDHVQPFLDMHYLYGLARAGRGDADTMLDSVRSFAGTVPGFVRAAWREVALPACEGLVAHARGNYGTAATRLLSVLPRLSEIGGSHAQRDLFEQLADDALIRSGKLAAAQNRLEQRRAGNPHSAPTLAKLAAVYRRLGLAGEAERVASISPTRSAVTGGVVQGDT